MTDNIRPLREGAQIGNPFKQQVLDYVAQRYDELTADGSEPVCIVFGLVAESATSAAHYLADSRIDSINALYLARAVTVVSHDYADWDKSHG